MPFSDTAIPFLGLDGECVCGSLWESSADEHPEFAPDANREATARRGSHVTVTCDCQSLFGTDVFAQQGPRRRWR
jgi:hypothetical protein